jgi:curved DNA-binding protein
VISRPHPLDVHIPAGVREGTRIRLAGQGQPGVNGGPSGDLYLVGRLEPHRLFRVTGDDLEIELPAYPWEAALGAEVEVPTLDGRVTLKVPPGTQAGQRLRLRGNGVGPAKEWCR